MSKRKEASSNAPSNAPQFSISRKYTGVAAFRDMYEDHVVRTAQFRARQELAERSINELKEGSDSTDWTEALKAAQNLMQTAQNVTGDLNGLDQEMQELKVTFSTLKDTINDIKENGPVGMALDTRRTALLDIFKELRSTYDSMMNQEGDVTTLEIQQLRTSNSALMNQVDLLKSQEETLRSLLVETYQTRAPAASSIEGIELPDWFPLDSDNPFEVIGEALRKLEKVNEELRNKCLDLQRHGNKQSDKILKLKENNAMLSARLTVFDNVGDLETATLRADVEGLQAQLKRERLTVEETRTERNQWVRRNAKLENQIRKLEQQCNRLANDNAKLKLEAAGQKTHQASINAIADEADKRIEGYRRREKTLISQVEATANERVKRAESEAEVAQKQVDEIRNSTDLNATILEQTRQLQQGLKDKADQAEERAKKAENEKQAADKAYAHLMNVQSDVGTARKAAEQKAENLTTELDTAKKTIELLNKQKQGLYEQVREYGEKEKKWGEDRAYMDQVARAAEEMKEDLEYAINRADQYEAAMNEARASMDFLSEAIMDQ